MIPLDPDEIPENHFASMIRGATLVNGVVGKPPLMPEALQAISDLAALIAYKVTKYAVLRNAGKHQEQAALSEMSFAMSAALFAAIHAGRESVANLPASVSTNNISLQIVIGMKLTPMRLRPSRTFAGGVDMPDDFRNALMHGSRYLAVSLQTDTEQLPWTIRSLNGSARASNAGARQNRPFAGTVGALWTLGGQYAGNAGAFRAIHDKDASSH